MAIKRDNSRFPYLPKQIRNKQLMQFANKEWSHGIRIHGAKRAKDHEIMTAGSYLPCTRFSENIL